jgi:hypothetical protein
MAVVVEGSAMERRRRRSWSERLIGALVDFLVDECTVLMEAASVANGWRRMFR